MAKVCGHDVAAELLACDNNHDRTDRIVQCEREKTAYLAARVNLGMEKNLQEAVITQ